MKTCIDAPISVRRHYLACPGNPAQTPQPLRWMPPLEFALQILPGDGIKSGHDGLRSSEGIGWTRLFRQVIIARMRHLIALITLVIATSAAADDIEVDLQLFLAVDVSRSMTERELEIQRRGYVEALTSPEVIKAVQRGYLGRIALTYVEWASAGAQRIIVDWTLIDSPADLRNFADQLTVRLEDGLKRTSISSVIDYAARDIDRNGFTSLRKVIDISGDGPNNAGVPVHQARDDAIAKGIVINGLPLMTKEGQDLKWHLPNLDRYYEACVIGGPGAFVVPVTDWAQFPAAVRRKLVQEMSGAPNITEAAFHIERISPTDCNIGEHILREMRDFYDKI